MWMCAGRHGWRAGGGQHPADGAVVRNRVRDRADGDERVGAVVAGHVAAAQMILLGLGTLDGVQHVGAVLPHVELRAGDRRASRVEHPAVNPGRHARAGLYDHALAVLAPRRPGHVERAEHGRLGGARRKLVGERVDQHRETERVRPEDELLAALVGDVAGVGEDRDQPAPLLLGQRGLDREAVQMADQALHEIAQAGIGTVVKARRGRGGDVRRRCSARAGRGHAYAPTTASTRSGSRRAASPSSESSRVSTSCS